MLERAIACFSWNEPIDSNFIDAIAVVIEGNPLASNYWFVVACLKMSLIDSEIYLIGPSMGSLIGSDFLVICQLCLQSCYYSLLVGYQIDFSPHHLGNCHLLPSLWGCCQYCLLMVSMLRSPLLIDLFAAIERHCFSIETWVWISHPPIILHLYLTFPLEVFASRALHDLFKANLPQKQSDLRSCLY